MKRKSNIMKRKNVLESLCQKKGASNPLDLLKKISPENLNNSQLAQLRDYFKENYYNTLSLYDNLSLENSFQEFLKFKAAFEIHGKEAFSMPEYKTGASIVAASLLKGSEIDFENKLKERSAAGGLHTKINSGNVKKPNDLLTAQLNPVLLCKYYMVKRPELFTTDMNDRKSIIDELNESAFYSAFNKVGFFEDALLSLAKHENETCENFLDIPHYTYRLPLEKFIQYSGARGIEKEQFVSFLHDVFKGKQTVRGTVYIRDKSGTQEKIKPVNTDFVSIVFEKELIKIGLVAPLFHSIISTKLNNTSTGGYIAYPEHLESRLRKATDGRYTVHIRRLYDFLLRDLENKQNVKKAASFVMASIDYGSAFNELDNFILNKTKIDVFLNKALAAINSSVKVAGKSVNYTWEGDRLVFSTTERIENL